MSEIGARSDGTLAQHLSSSRDPFAPNWWMADQPEGVIRRTSPDLGAPRLSQVLRRWLPLIAALSLAAFVLSTLLAISMPEVFRAEAKLILQSQDAPLFEALPQQERSEIDRQAVETELQVIQSRELAAYLVDRLELVTDPYFGNPPEGDDPPGAEAGTASSWLEQVAESFAGSLKGLASQVEAWFEPPEAPVELAPAELRERTISRFRSRLEASRLGQSLAISIVASHSDPVEAARIANEAARGYIDLGTRRSRERTQRAIGFLSARAEDLAQEVSDLEQLIVDQRLEYAIDDPGRRQALRARIEQLEARSELFGSEDGSAARAAIAEELTQARLALAAFASAEIGFRKIEDELAGARTRYDLVIERLSNLDLKAEPLNTPARIVSPAEVPEEPYAPRRKLIVAAGTSAGLFVSLLLVMVLEGTDTRIRSAREVREASGLRTLAYVPEMPRSIRRRGRVLPHEAVVRNPRERFSEAMHDLLAECAFPRAGSGSAVAITSPLPGDGKTTIALGLAVAAALSGRRTVLVDLDIFRRGAGQMLAPQAKTVHPVEPDLIDHSLKICPDLGGLYVLGPATRGALDPDVIEDLLLVLRKRFEAIVIDTSPVLVQAGTSRVLPLADASILVVRWGRTDASVLNDALEEMEPGQSPIGVAISRVNARRHRRGGYSGSPAYSSYGTRASAR